MPIINERLRRQRSHSSASIYRKSDRTSSSGEHYNRELMNKYRLCLKYVPKDVTQEMIEKLCSQYGKIINITFSQKTPFKFVSFSSLNEMESALTGLKDNQYGFVVDIAKSRHHDDDTLSVAESLLDIAIKEDEPKSSNIKDDKKMNKNNDKQNNHYRNRNRSRYGRCQSEERDIKKTNETSNKKDSKEATQKDDSKNQVKPSSSSSQTIVNAEPITSENTTINATITTITTTTTATTTPVTLPITMTTAAMATNIINDDNNDYIFGHCAFCMKSGNKSCARCGDCYCSLECQKMDWKRHRYFCFAMPHLVPLPRDLIPPNMQNVQESRKMPENNSAIQANYNNCSGSQGLEGMPLILRPNLPSSQYNNYSSSQGLQGTMPRPNPPSSQYNNYSVSQGLQGTMPLIPRPNPPSSQYNNSNCPQALNTPVSGIYNNQQIPLPQQSVLYLPQQTMPLMQNNFPSPFLPPQSYMNHVPVTQFTPAPMPGINNNQKQDSRAQKDQKQMQTHMDNKKIDNKSSNINANETTKSTTTNNTQNKERIEEKKASSTAVIKPPEKDDDKNKKSEKLNQNATKENTLTPTNKLEQNVTKEMTKESTSKENEVNKVPEQSALNNTDSNTSNDEQFSTSLLNEKVSSIDFPENGSRVQITAVIKPNFLYIRSLDSKSDVEYVKLLNNVNNESKKLPFLKNLPQKGDLIAADFDGLGYYRGLVLNVTSSMHIVIAFIDIGKVEVKRLSDLKELSSTAISFKRYVFPIKLKGIENLETKSKENIDKAMKYAEQFEDDLSKDLKIVYDKKDNGNGSDNNNKLSSLSNDLYEIELIDLSCNESVNENIKKLLE